MPMQPGSLYQNELPWKPLTEFENYKARLEALIAPIDPAQELAHKIDGDWADVFWAYRGSDDLIDGQQLFNYLSFLIEACEWRKGTVVAGTTESRTRALFDANNPAARDHLRYLIEAFDTWAESDPSPYFTALVASAGQATSGAGSVPIFLSSGITNPFVSCINTYGQVRGATCVFHVRPATAALRRVGVSDRTLNRSGRHVEEASSHHQEPH